MTIMDNTRFRIRHPVIEKECISRLLKGSVRSARTLSSLDQRSIAVFLHMKGLSVKDIHTKLVQVHGSDAIAYSTVTKYLRSDIVLQNEPGVENRAEDQGFSIRDNAILEAFEIISFASIRQIAKMTFIPPTTVFRHLMKLLHFVLKRLLSVPADSRIFKNRLWSSCQRSY
jgi:hypothetical protein